MLEFAAGPLILAGLKRPGVFNPGSGKRGNYKMVRPQKVWVGHKLYWKCVGGVSTQINQLRNSRFSREVSDELQSGSNRQHLSNRPRKKVSVPHKVEIREINRFSVKI
jgi:hypothetical protein